MSNHAFETISSDQLVRIVGGTSQEGEWGKDGVKKVAKNVAKVGARALLKKVPVAGWAYAGYSAVEGYNKARSEGKNVAESLGQGALDFLF